MFCTSLRGRHEWKKVPAILLAIEFPKWKGDKILWCIIETSLYRVEHKLDTFDVALPITSQNPIRSSTDFFHIVLLSSVDLKQSHTVSARIQRLFYKQGGKNVGIIYLLNEQGQEDNGPKALMDLQTSFLSEFEIPILLLFSIESLEVTMKAFQKQLGHPMRPSQRSISAVTLLPFCSINPPIPNHARNLLSDICPNISGLLALVTTREGIEKLTNVLSSFPGLAQNIISFWHSEYVAE